MGLTSRLFFTLTLVLAPLVTPAIPLVLPAPNGPAGQKVDGQKPSATVEESLDLSVPDPGEYQPGLLLDADDFHDFLFVSTGYALGNEQGSVLFGIAHHQRQKIVHAWSYGLELFLSKQAFLFGGYSYLLRKWQILRPELTLDFGVRAIPDQALATFVNSDNFFFRLGTAMNFHWRAGNSFRVEARLAQGLTESYVSLGAGYVWVWR